MTKTEPGAGSARLIIPTGTQVVTRVAVKDREGNVVCPAGATLITEPEDTTMRKNHESEHESAASFRAHQ